MNSKPTYFILVVDDDPLIHQTFKLIAPPSWKVFSVQNYEDITVDRFYHAAFVDMHLKPGSDEVIGPKVIEKLVKNNAQLEVIAMSGNLDRSIMESCLRVGATKFISKPLFPEEVTPIIEKIEALWGLRKIEQNSGRIPTNFIGKSQKTAEVKKRVAEFKGEGFPVLIEGETGTGKEVIARLLNIQEESRPFVAVNVGSIPENLFESEMFGHVKGAFTGAEQNKIGLIEASHGGDLFLDEIEAFPLHLQVKILRFLETGEIKKVGSKDTQYIQTRVIAATNKPLEILVKEGEFREDLMFRLNAQKITLPPLRDRKEDIPLLAEHFLASEKPKRNKQFTSDGLTALQNYDWPGNVRELKRLCAQLSLTSPLPFIRGEDVTKWIHPGNSIMPANFSEQSSGPVDFSQGITPLINAYEKKLIETALKLYKDIESTSAQLKMSRSNLYKKIKDYGIEGGF